MSKIVRIGGACAFYGDSSVAPAQLLEAGVDYLILDYLAEATMSVLGAMRKKRDTLGYAHDFTEWVWKDNLEALKRSGTRIVTNAGGVNPQACAARMRKIATEAGLDFHIAVVEGDDLIGRLDELEAECAGEMFTGIPFPPKEAIVTANAYLGATPIARALALGADMVITGRVVDSALTLGPLIHEFGWTPQDYDQLCAGSLAGHVVECGAQGSGGLFTDWEGVPDWAHIGYPIVECEADGAFTVTKPDGTGGLVSPAVVAEQILYEVGDPQAYMLPDVVCDFTRLKLEQTGAHRVRVTGAVGYAPSGLYKVSITHKDGDRCIAFMPVVGREAARKAQRQGEAVLTRVEEMLRARNLAPFRAKRIEIIGAEASYGANARAGDTREVVCKVAVEHDDPKAFDLFLREFDSPTTSMAVGTTGWFGGRGQVTPVMRVFSTTIEREAVPARITLNDREETVAAPPPPQRFELASVHRPAPGEEAVAEGATRSVPLIDLAWARSGDKGDAFNIGVIARRPDYLPYIRAALKEEALLDFFAHEFEGGRNPAVRRYEVPGLDALNFHFLDSLGGGQFASLRLDPLAKGKAQQLLDFAVTVPADLR
ncbi:MAG: acyclic terpene utilization AtuA family protein [Sphingobium sp.]